MTHAAPHPDARLSHLPVNFFAVVMGLAGLALTRVHDYAVAESRAPNGRDVEPIGLPATDLLQLDFVAVAPAAETADGRFHASIRPSGTEPKVKVYLEYLGQPGSANLSAEAAAAERQLQALGAALIPHPQ